MPGQTLQDFEVIIVDDNEGDTKQVPRELVDGWKGIRVIHRSSSTGTAPANNAEIQAAFGQAIIVIAAEDIVEPHWLETLYREWEQHPDDLIYDGAVQMNRRRVRYGHRNDYRIHTNTGIMFAKHRSPPHKGTSTRLLASTLHADV
jgi:GT2 family glycosyltransferase